MAVKKFCTLLHELKLGKKDKLWFPRWIRRYAWSVGVVEGDLFVSEASVKEFSRSLLRNGTPAWQRLQAVRAVEAYRDLVLHTDQPSLREIRLTLGRLADQEKAVGTGHNDHPGVGDERHLIGWIDPREPAVIQQMRRELRVRRKSLETERSYVGWARRFLKHCRTQELQESGEPEIAAFLTQLAVEGDVTAGTQKQAKSALLFLFQSVLGRDLGFLDARGPQAKAAAGGAQPRRDREAAAPVRRPKAVDVPGDVRRRPAAPGMPAVAGQGCVF
jgi:hypothetical protein